MNTLTQRGLQAVLALALSVSTGLVVAEQTEREVLYWYDPMYPQQRFDAPGKSPFMDMDLVPRYAEPGGDASGLRIDPRVTQNLGVRLAEVRRAPFDQPLVATGNLAFDARSVAVVQARSGGFVERVHPLAPGDVIAAGAPLAELLIPEWAAAQEEFLGLRRLGEPELLAAARQRLRLAGMPADLIARLERTGQVQSTWTIASPRAGVIETLEVRQGMTLAPGQTLARINGLDPVWLEVAVPEAQAGRLAAGQAVEARLVALPGQVLRGEVDAILPQADAATRTVTVRVVLPNPDGRLRPGMSAEAELATATGEPTLAIPTEAVIRTGRRALVMRADGEGRFQPVEIRTGRESTELTEVLEGLSEGQQVVASGQFLLDSEASLRGLAVQTLGSTPAAPPPALHEAEGTLVALDGDMVGLSHGPFETLGMPGMTMPFPVADPALLKGLKVGDRVRVGVRQTDDGLLIERIEKLAGHAEHTPAAPEAAPHEGHH